MSNKKLSTTKKGFTIIEVVLVLAIAGLIFLMVFVALPALQRNQRDTQRRSDVGRLVTAVTSYRTNTGDMPANMTTANKTIADTNLNGYIDNFNDPGTSTGYLVKIQTLTSGGTGSGENICMYTKALNAMAQLQDSKMAQVISQSFPMLKLAVLFAKITHKSARIKNHQLDWWFFLCNKTLCP